MRVNPLLKGPPCPARVVYKQNPDPIGRERVQVEKPDEPWAHAITMLLVYLYHVLDAGTQ